MTAPSSFTGLVDGPVELVPVSELREHPDNPRQGNVAVVVESIQRNGFYGVVIRQASTGYILAGNHRTRAAREAGLTHVPVQTIDVNDEQARRILLADNRTADLASYDEKALAEMLEEIRLEPGGLLGTGYTDDDLLALLGPQIPHRNGGEAPTLADRFLVPPFSVLDARSGAWQERKKRWLALGIHSEIGRDQGMLGFSIGMNDTSWYAQKNAVEAELGRAVSKKEFVRDYYKPEDSAYASNTSIFDPVLCEIAYRWFCPPGGRVIDPWAGGSVRGVMAAQLGREYVGIELRQVQVDANEAQRHLIPAGAPQPEWICGASPEALDALPAGSFDLAFGCPPYFDLEKYSDDPRDLSRMTPEGFEATYRATFQQLARVLADDSFCVMVVGSVRDKNGMVRDLAALTTAAAAAAGLHLYNDAVLVTAVGGLRFRAGGQFTNSRALGRTHQYVMVYLKGDRKRATARCGEVDVSEALELAEAKAAESDTGE